MPQPAAWTSTYRLSSATRQQRILRALQRLDHPGIKALGTTSECDYVIVIECASAAAEIRSRHVVMAVDVHAVRTETTRVPRVRQDDRAIEAADGPDRAAPRRILKLMPPDRFRRLM